MKMRLCAVLASAVLLALLFVRQWGPGGPVQAELLDAELRVAGLGARLHQSAGTPLIATAAARASQLPFTLPPFVAATGMYDIGPSLRCCGGGGGGGGVRGAADGWCSAHAAE
jgi:hypothetical protein